MNLPNKISVSRIVLIPVMILFYLLDPIVPYGRLIALGVYIIASLTDMLDGHIARSRNLVTNLGKLLDSIADKMLNVAALLLVIIDGTIPAPFGVLVAIIIICRELLISILRQLAATAGYVMAADQIGRVKAFVQDIAIALLFLVGQIINSSNHLGMSDGLVLGIQIVSYVAMGIAVLLTIISAMHYLIKNRAVFKEN